MRKLFEKTLINSLELPNRFVRSATWEGLASSDGSVTPELMDKMLELARGGVGLIITSHAYVQAQGQAGPGQLGVYKDELIPGLRKMVDEIHENNGKIIMQLAHAGKYAPYKLTKKSALVVSYLEDSERPQREMTHEDIDEIIRAFAQAAKRAKESGFDGVQIHSGHGYLLSQFLSPRYNHRQDEYGGNIYNRSRIHLETYHAIRQNVGSEFPIMIKMNCRDFLDDGLGLSDSIQLGKMLADAGIDAIELSGGIIKNGNLEPSRVGIRSRDEEAYFREEAKIFKGEVGVPLILVGGIRSLEIAEDLLANGQADYLSMSRPLICEPDLINRWKSGDISPSLCKSDNLCLKSGQEGSGVYCVVNARRNRRLGN